MSSIRIHVIICVRFYGVERRGERGERKSKASRGKD